MYLHLWVYKEKCVILNDQLITSHPPHDRRKEQSENWIQWVLVEAQIGIFLGNSAH